jgi:hypothetical protein
MARFIHRAALLAGALSVGAPSPLLARDVTCRDGIATGCDKLSRTLCLRRDDQDERAVTIPPINDGRHEEGRIALRSCEAWRERRRPA